MSLLTATAVDCEVPRGSNKTIYFSILDEDGLDYDLTDHTVTLVMTTERETEEIICQIDGVVDIAYTNVVGFSFTPEDTEGLLCRAYNIDIIVEDNDTEYIYPPFRGSIGVTAMVLPEEE